MLSLLWWILLFLNENKGIIKNALLVSIRKGISLLITLKSLYLRDNEKNIRGVLSLIGTMRHVAWGGYATQPLNG